MKKTLGILIASSIFLSGIVSAQPIQVSDMGAYQFHKQIVELNKSSKNKDKVSSFNQNSYSMFLKSGETEIPISFVVNESGYVSEILAISSEPMDLMNALSFFTNVDSGTYLENEYKRLKKAGVTADRALEEADNRAAKYQSDRIKALEKALFLFGINARNEINTIGMQLLSMMLEECNDKGDGRANLYANMLRPSRTGYPEPTNNELSKIVCNRLALVFAALGFTINEYNVLINNFSEGESSVWCSALNRRVIVETKTISGGNSVQIHITASSD